MLLRHREQFPRAAARIYATFDLGVIGYWAIPTAPPWFAAQRGLMEDGLTPELRRMMVEYGEQFWKQGWAPLYGVLGGNPLAAMPSLHFATSVTAAHVLGDTGRVAGAFGWAYAATLGLALVYLGEHYVVDLVAGLTLAEGIRVATPPVAAGARRVSAALQVLEAQGAGMTRVPEQTVDQPSPGDAHDDDDRGLEFSGRTVLTLCGFLVAMIAGLYFLLPQLAGLEDTWERIEDGSPKWIVLALVLTLGMFAGYVAMFRGVFGHVDRIRLARELPDHDGRAGGVADLRRGRRRRARPAGLGAAAGRHGEARGRRQDDLVPRAHLLALRRGRDPLRRRPAARHLPGRGAVHDDRDPGDHRGDPDGADEPDPARADRPAAAARRVRASAPARSGGSPSGWP